MSTPIATNTDYTGQEIVATNTGTITDGISPKTVLAFLFPLIAALITALVSFAVTGDFDASEIKVAATGVGASLVSALGAYVGSPGRQLPLTAPTAHDSLIPDEYHGKIKQLVDDTPADPDDYAGD